jgi:hypothetical protein
MLWAVEGDGVVRLVELPKTKALQSKVLSRLYPNGWQSRIEVKAGCERSHAARKVVVDYIMRSKFVAGGD